MSLPGTLPGDATFSPVLEWRQEVLTRLKHGARLLGLYGTAEEDGCVLTALLGVPRGVAVRRTRLSASAESRLEYPSLTPQVPAAFWYERALHDLSGVVPVGHPRLDPLLLARDETSPAPRPGGAPSVEQPRGREEPAAVELGGHGLFSLPLGPVRSGVMESIELLIETPGEDIPHLNVRPHYKHRGIAKQFEGRTVADAVLVAERVEGISSVAHALAFCHAVEALAGLTPTHEARLVRVLLAELERVANHLDVTVRLADAAGLAVATSRFGWHKERVQRMLSSSCGSRFGRGVVTVGGLARHLDPLIDLSRTATVATELRASIAADVTALESSASFLDRLRTTGPLQANRAAEHGALGPIGRASGVNRDSRRDVPYDAYAELGGLEVPVLEAGDALARARVRWREIDTSLELVRAALTRLSGRPRERISPVVQPPDGLGVGWAESAQGEVVHAVEIEGGRVRRAFARSASLHNLLLLHDVFAGDIFTDLPFIEASFGLGYAGVAM
jgi:formate hydrogenlyase subunit 5